MGKKESIRAFLDKAKRSIEIAELSLKAGSYDFAISRAYYAAFYCATALLRSSDMVFKRHSAIIANFAKEFVKSGIFDAKYSEYLRDSFELRQESDYSEVIMVTQDEALEGIENAKEFLIRTTEYLKEHGFP